MKRIVLPLSLSILLGIGLISNSSSTIGSANYCNLATENVIEVEPISVSYQKVIKGVVGIQTEYGKLGSIGSGFIYDEDNKYQYVLTNYHVVTTQKTAYVRLHSGDIIKADVIGKEPSIDVALLRMPKQKDVVVLKMGNSLYLNVGEKVFAVGNPLSVEYDGHLSLGIVSGVNRLFTKVSSLEERQYLIQIDTPVNPGNSGGPLFNVLGQVVGITSSKSIISYEGQQQEESISFAIPINDVKIIASQLRVNEVFFPTSLGDNTYEDVALLNRQEKEALSIPNEINRGVYVAVKNKESVFKNITADAIILTKVDDIELTSAGQLRNVYFPLPPGYKLTFTYIKVLNGEMSVETITVTTLIKH
jgi:serine protease Do